MREMNPSRETVKILIVEDERKTGDYLSNDFYHLWLDEQMCIPAPISPVAGRRSTRRSA